MDAMHDKWGGPERHVVLYAHGGLTSGGTGQDIARRDLGWWLANQIYPITFAWQTGAIETLLDQLADLARRLPARRRPAEWLTEQADRAVEVRGPEQPGLGLGPDEAERARPPPRPCPARSTGPRRDRPGPARP